MVKLITDLLFGFGKVVKLKRAETVQQNKYLWGVREGEESWKVQDFTLMTPYVSSIIDNNLGSSYMQKIQIF